MATALELRQKRAALVADMRKVLDKADTEKRSLTGEESAQYAKQEKDVDALKGEIDQRERLDNLEKELKDPAEKRNGVNHEDRSVEVAAGAQDKALKELRNKAHRKHLQHGAGSLTAEERSAIELRATGDATITGYGVSDGFQVELFDNLKWYSGVEQAPIDYRRTTSGNQFPIIVSDDTGNTGELLAENTQTASNADATMTQVTLGTYLFSSKAILVSMQALQDIESLEKDVIQNAAMRIGRIRGSYFTTGTGTSQPTGIVTAATAAGLSLVGAVGQTTTLIPDNIIDLERKIDPAYRLLRGKDGKRSCGYMMNDLTVGAVRKLKDSQNRYIWQAGLTAGDPDTINAYPYYINNFMATMAANAKSIIFGYWPAFVVRDVAETIMLRLAERYADSFQVGFLAAVRSDSKVKQTNAFAYYQNSAT